MEHSSLPVRAALCGLADPAMVPFLMDLRDAMFTEHKRFELRFNLSNLIKNHIGGLPPHQIEARSPFRDVRGPAHLLKIALNTVCDRLLTWHGRPVLRFEHLLEFGACTKAMQVDQLWAWCFQAAAREQRACLKDFDRWDGRLFPDVPSPLLENLFRKGLIDSHQHYHNSSLPSHIWKLALNDLSPLKRSSYGFADGAINLPTRWRQVELYYHLEGARFARKLLAMMIRKSRELNTRGMSPQRDAAPWVPNAFITPILTALMGIKDHYREQMPPVFPSLPPAGGPFTNERYFLAACFDHLDQFSMAAAPAEAEFIFTWSLHYYLLIQNLFMQSYVQQDQHMGFEEFSRFERGVGAQTYKDHKLFDMLTDYRDNHHLKAVELRIVPGTTVNDHLAYFTSLFRAKEWQAHKDNSKLTLETVNGPIQAGFIFHVIKKKDALTERIRRECRERRRRHDDQAFCYAHDFAKHEDPPLAAQALSGGIVPARHNRLRREVFLQTRAVIYSKRFAPLYEGACLGLDAANDERFAGPEVFAPTFRLARDTFATFFGEDNGPRRWENKPRPLRITFHAGESFDHVLTGLRTMDEAMTFLDMRPGDRIGHGLAAGIDIDQWADLVGDAAVSQGVWLDNLVWMDQTLAASVGVPSSVLSYIQRNIAFISRRIYRRCTVDPKDRHALDAASLHRAWTFRGQEPVDWIREREPLLERRLQIAKTKDSDAYQLWRQYHFDPVCRTAYEEPLDDWSDLPPRKAWHQALTLCQNRILAKMRDSQIAVEINPTSNLRIGCFYQMEEHPVFRWNPVDGPPKSPAPQVVIGADNYCIFQTTLPLEYAYLAKAAMDKGHDLDQVEQWLDGMRRNGFKYSFMDVAD